MDELREDMFYETRTSVRLSKNYHCPSELELLSLHEACAAGDDGPVYQDWSLLGAGVAGDAEYPVRIPPSLTLLDHAIDLCTNNMFNLKHDRELSSYSERVITITYEWVVRSATMWNLIGSSVIPIDCRQGAVDLISND